MGPISLSKTQPSEGAGAAPAGPTKPALAINGTAPNAALSKEYVRMVGRFAVSLRQACMTYPDPSC
jgi:hypothetical protein